MRPEGSPRHGCELVERPSDNDVDLDHGQARTVRQMCRPASEQALAAVIGPDLVPDELLWVVCEMAWAIEDLDAAGLASPWTPITPTGGGPGIAPVWRVLIALDGVCDTAMQAIGDTADYRIRDACRDAMRRAAACRAVLTGAVLVHLDASARATGPMGRVA